MITFTLPNNKANKMESINNHRSIRKYSKEPVSNELLTRLLQEAERTQTMGNMQLYSVVITRSAEMKKKLSPLHFNQPMVEEAPVVLTFCADFNRAVKWCLNREANPGYNNLLSFIKGSICLSITVFRLLYASCRKLPLKLTVSFFRCGTA